MNNVKDFVELLNTDKTYQEKFEVAAKAYKGEITDEAIWEAIIGPLAAEAGYDITFDDYKAYVDGFTKNNEISLDELDAVFLVVNGEIVDLLVHSLLPCPQPRTGAGRDAAAMV